MKKKTTHYASSSADACLYKKKTENMTKIESKLKKDIAVIIVSHKSGQKKSIPAAFINHCTM